MRKNLLLLFDIDGTLIDTGGAGMVSLKETYQKFFGIKDAFSSIQMSGKTDIQIMKEGFRAHQLEDSEENLNKVIENYLTLLKTNIGNPNRHLKQGVHAFLERVEKEEYPCGLLTGNLEKGAKIKLSPFGLNEFFTTGAFCSDHEDRNELVPIALNKFSKLKIIIPTESVVVIGDTPRDIECAKIHGAHSIATCTGPFSKKELSAAEPDLVIESLLEIEKCFELFAQLAR